MKRFLPIIYLLFIYSAKAQNCSDTAFKMRYYSLDSVYANDQIITTAQETIILGEIREYPRKKTLLLKVDIKGNKIWSKQYVSLTKLNATKIVQFSDGTFVMGGTALQNNRALTLFIAKLDQAGNLIWQNFYPFNNNGNLNNIYLQSITEGIGHEILVSWKRGGINFLIGDDHESAVLMLLNSNGNIAWSKNFIADLAKLAGAYQLNGKIIVLGQAYDRSLNCPGGTGGILTAMRLDYSTGNIELQKNFCYEEPGGMIDSELATPSYSSVKLDNGDFALFGLYFNATGTNYCYKVLFNDQLNPYYSRRYSTFDPRSNDPLGSSIQVLPSGATVISSYNYIRKNGLYGYLNSQENILLEKSIDFSPDIIPIDFIYNFSANTYWTFKERNNKLSLLTNHTSSQRQNIELSVIHKNGDTSACFGADTHFILSSQFHFTPNTSLSWNNIIANRVAVAAGDFSVASYDIEQQMQCIIIRKPSINLGKDTSICLGDSIVLSAENDFLNYNWQPAVFHPLSATAIKVSPKIATSYILQATTRDGCEVSDTVQVSVHPLPSHIIITDTAICQFDELQLKPLRSFNSYLWNDGTVNPYLNVNTPGRYWLQVTDQNGCVGKENILVRSKECPVSIFFPNAFTPNNDGKNDLFRPVSSGRFISYEFQVYNRWGEIVFHSKDPQKGWDGKLKGKQQQNGVFVWHCRYQLPGDKQKEKKGTVLLIQ